MRCYTFDDFVAAAKKMQEIKKRTVHTVVYHPNDWDVLKSTLEKDGLSALTLHPLMRVSLLC